MDSAFFQIELLCKAGARNHSNGLLQDSVETGLVLLISQFHRMIALTNVALHRPPYAAAWAWDMGE
jgi:hypothetical protein